MPPFARPVHDRETPDRVQALPEPRIAEHAIAVRRTARYHTRGVASAAVRELWYVCHGYGQLAGDFIRAFEPIDDGTRLVVAPEALSRFYLGSDMTRHAEVPVGATWMTREARLTEIDDYVAYLDALHERMSAELGAAGARDVRVRVLGFSQGAATVARWVARGSVRAHDLILWGGLFPADAAEGPGLARVAGTSLTVVVGRGDQFATAERLSEQERLFARLGLRPRHVPFDGGHKLDRETLLSLAAGDGAAGA